MLRDSVIKHIVFMHWSDFEGREALNQVFQYSHFSCRPSAAVKTRKLAQVGDSYNLSY